MNIEIKILEPENITERCLKWYSDPDVVRFSDNQYRKFSMESQCQYVATCLRDSTMDLYGIFYDDLHVGNLSITDLDPIHSRAEISYMIGERSYWGKGAATLAISQIIELAVSKYQLNKLFAGVAEDNYGSRKVLEKNGFAAEGRRINHVFYEGCYHNQIDYGLILTS